MGSPSTGTARPSSDQQLWSALCSRVDTLVVARKRHAADRSPTAACGEESRCGKRLREDSLLLIRGLDSVASSSSQLKDTLDGTAQGVENLVNPSFTDLLRRETWSVEEDEAAAAKTSSQCASAWSEENPVHDRAGDQRAAKDGELKDSKEIPVGVAKDGTLKKIKNLAISMASKASSLARQLETIKSELGFVREKCALLEEENRRLRYGDESGLGSDEDDLVRLQLEALLAEKSRLSNENATLTRENQRLQQLVEYHQLTSQDLSETYEQFMQGICLDFSSPSGKSDADFDEDNDQADIAAPCTPCASVGCCTSDECSKEQKQVTIKWRRMQ